MQAYLGRLVCVLSGLWLVGNILMPPWLGWSYISDSADPYRMQQSGGFGLAETADQHPLWNPPSAFSPDIRSSFRWPWESVPSGAAAYHVEIDVQSLLFHISLGLVVMGFAARLLVPKSLPASEQRYIHLAWCWAWAALLACLLYLATWAITCQWGERPPETATLIGYACLLLGASIHSLRYSLVSDAESVSTSTAGATAAVSKSREKATTLVVGLLTGGAAGWGLAMLILILFPSRPGPEYPGLGAAVGQMVVCVTGLVCGSIAGTLIALVRINQTLRAVPISPPGPDASHHLRD